MARRPADGRATPYAAVVRLSCWATARASLLRIRLRRDGIDPRDLSAGDALDLIYEYLLAEQSTVWVADVTVREQLDEFLADPSILPRSARRRVHRGQRATWGTTPEAREGAKAMMALAGGPASIRKGDAAER